MLLQLKQAQFRFGDVTVFQDVNLELNEGDNVGVVGANGAGKSTLLSCIYGDLELFSGSIYKKNGLTMGFLRQNSDLNSSLTLFDELMSVFSEQTRLISQLNETARLMAKAPADGDEYRRLADKYHRLTVEADVSEAYDCEVKVKTVLNGMGMSEFSDRTASTLSGGEKTKAALCKLLLQRPELLILDEPTNHLDYKTLDWLEAFLSDKKSTLLVVSHDRYFLDKLCTSVWDVQHKRVETYKGNYTKYKALKAERRESLRREYDRQQKEIAKLTDYIARNKVRASTADMAKSREKTLDKMTLIEAPKRDEQPPRFKFGYSSEPSEFPLTLSDMTLGYDKPLLANASLTVKRGDKVALLGLNGSGKSTLIKRIASPKPQDLGKIVFGKNVRVGYYDQENLNLRGDLRVLDQLWFDNTRMSQTEVRSLLAAVTLGADDVYKRVSDLSGGERAKLGLAMIMAKDCNLLLLDEPTNHLDLPSREALEEALTEYSGTLLFVSHDRYFVNALSTKIAVLENNSLTVSEGNYEAYTSAKKSAEANSPKPVKAAQSTYRSARQRAEETNRAKKLKELENRITELETEIADLNAKSAEPEYAADYSKLAPVLQRLSQADAELEQVMTEWETLQTE